MATNKLLLPAVAIAALFAIASKKSGGSKGTTNVPKTDDPPKEEEDHDDDIPSDPPKKEPPKQEPPPSPDYSLLTSSRQNMANTILDKLPMSFYGPPIWSEYSVWAKNQSNPSYLFFITNQIYWAIARAEGKSEWIKAYVNNPNAYADNLYAIGLPFLLKCGETVDVEKWNKNVAGVFKFNETTQQCDKRIAYAKKLWNQIYNYVKNNIKGCPQGATC